MRRRNLSIDELLWDISMAAGNQLIWAEAVANGQAVRCQNGRGAVSGQNAIFEALQAYRHGIQSET